MKMKKVMASMMGWQRHLCYRLQGVADLQVLQVDLQTVGQQTRINRFAGSIVSHLTVQQGNWIRMR